MRLSEKGRRLPMLGISGSLREPWPGQSKCSRRRMSPRCRRHWLVWRCRCAFLRRVRISLRCCNRLHGVCSFQFGDNDVVFGRNRACRRDDGETGTGDDNAKCCNVHGRGYWLVMANLSYIFECAKVFCAFFLRGATALLFNIQIQAPRREYRKGELRRGQNCLPGRGTIHCARVVGW